MEYTITESEAQQRLDRFCRKYFKPYPEIGLSDIYAWIRKGVIKVNGRKSKENYTLQEDDIVAFRLDHKAAGKLQQSILDKDEKSELLKLSDYEGLILYEDQYWLVRNKPAGIVTHPGDKHTSDLSLHDYLLRYLALTDQTIDSPTFSPSFCFRLDKDTSGVLIAAKTYESLQELNMLIREKQVSKQYTTILSGHIPKETYCDEPLFVGYNKQSGRSQSFVNHEKGKDAYSKFIPLDHSTHPQLGDITLAHVLIETGRMHQIRVHAAHIGYPVVGDITYGNPAINRIASKQVQITRQLLHSSTYGFLDRFADKQRQFTAPLPIDFTQLFPSHGTHTQGLNSGN